MRQVFLDCNEKTWMSFGLCFLWMMS